MSNQYPTKMEALIVTFCTVPTWTARWKCSLKDYLLMHFTRISCVNAYVNSSMCEQALNMWLRRRDGSGDLHKQRPCQASVMCWVGARELTGLTSSCSPKDSETANSIAPGHLIYVCVKGDGKVVNARVTVRKQEMEAIFFLIFNIKIDFFFFFWNSRQWCGRWLLYNV